MVYDTRNNRKNDNRAMSVGQPFLLKKVLMVRQILNY